MVKFNFKSNEIVNADGEKIFKNSEFEFEPGITVLVGCNGSGKTTLMNTIQNHLDHNIKYSKHYALQSKQMMEQAMTFSHGSDRVNAIDYFGYSNWASEGEGIFRRFEYLVQNLGYYVLNECKNQSEGWIFLDSLDSGMSIDNIQEVKDFLQNIVLGETLPENLNLYILIAANSYEFAKDQRCLDVQNAKYISFENYEDYVEFILESRNYKDNRTVV